jgi:hypothetical protein
VSIFVLRADVVQRKLFECNYCYGI